MIHDVDILSEFGYTEGEIQNANKNLGVIHDEQRYVDKSNTSVQSRYDRYVRRGVDGVGEVFDNRRWGQTRGIPGRSEPLGRSDTGTDTTIDRQFRRGIKYSIAPPDTDTTPAVDFKACAENIGPRDTARINELRSEIDSVNRSINSLERGLRRHQ